MNHPASSSKAYIETLESWGKKPRFEFNLRNEEGYTTIEVVDYRELQILKKKAINNDLYFYVNDYNGPTLENGFYEVEA